MDCKKRKNNVCANGAKNVRNFPISLEKGRRILRLRAFGSRLSRAVHVRIARVRHLVCTLFIYNFALIDATTG